MDLRKNNILFKLRIVIIQNGRKQRNPAAEPAFPGCWISREISREVGRGGQFPGKFRGLFPSSRGNSPGNFPGFGISREVGFGIRLPGKFPVESAAPDCEGSPWELIAIKSGISVRRRCSGGPQPQVMTRLEAFPASPRAGAGVSGPIERLGPHVPEFRGLRPSLFRN